MVRVFAVPAETTVVPDYSEYATEETTTVIIEDKDLVPSDPTEEIDTTAPPMEHETDVAESAITEETTVETITQNVEYLLDSVQASTMLSNSEFVIMLNQAASDRAKLAKLLNISEIQMRYITNAPAGSGLIKYGSALVPFVNKFNKDTKLYQLMTTKPGEGQFANG